MNTSLSEHGRSEIPRAAGLRHVALRVSSVAASKAFYQTWFGMAVVWEPDTENVYLSSGVDNLALHQLPDKERAAGRDHEAAARRGHGEALDHLGFVMESTAGVDELYRHVVRDGVEIVHHPKAHRDGSYSFYLADPDGIVIQVLYEPTISAVRWSPAG